MQALISITVHVLVPFTDFDLWDPHTLPVDSYLYSDLFGASSGYASLESSISSDLWNEGYEDDEVDALKLSV